MSNPYAEGTSEHIAWEEGYLAAIEDDVVVMDSFFSASGIETEGQDRETGLGAEHESPTVKDGDAQSIGGHLP